MKSKGDRWRKVALPVCLRHFFLLLRAVTIFWECNNSGTSGWIWHWQLGHRYDLLTFVVLWSDMTVMYIVVQFSCFLPLNISLFAQTAVGRLLLCYWYEHQYYVSFSADSKTRPQHFSSSVELNYLLWVASFTSGNPVFFNLKRIGYLINFNDLNRLLLNESHICELQP